MQSFDELLMHLSLVLEERGKALAALDDIETELLRYTSLQHEKEDLLRKLEKLAQQTQFLTKELTPHCTHPYEWRGGRQRHVCTLCGRLALLPAIEEEDDDDDFG